MPNSAEVVAKGIVERYLDRKCYGTQYSDHDKMCQVCPLSRALATALTTFAAAQPEPCHRLHIDPCDYCGKEQTERGGVEFTPGPGPLFHKRHVCLTCGERGWSRYQSNA